MNLTRKQAILYGIGTVWAPIYMAISACFILVNVAWGLSTKSNEPPLTVWVFVVIFPLHLLTIILMMAMVALSIVHLIKNPRLSTDRRIVWALAVFFAGIVAMPLYWYIEIWPHSKGQGPPASRVDEAPGEGTIPPS